MWDEIGYIGRVATPVLFIAVLLMSIGIAYGGSAPYILGTDGNVSGEESTYVDDLTSWINDAATYGTHHPGIIYADPSATEDSILDVANPPEDPVLVFFVGHGEYDALALHIIYLIVDNNNDVISDNTTYSLTGSRKVHFVFLHSCFQGAEIGGYFTIP